jgi:hypothetical protein
MHSHQFVLCHPKEYHLALHLQHYTNKTNKLHGFSPQAKNTDRPLWSSGQSSWLQIQRSWYDSRHYQIFWEVVSLEQGPLSLVRIIEEIFQGNSSCGLENRD